MATDKNLQNLIINKLTKEQYDAIDSPSPDELYLIPDEIDDAPTQGSDNPVKSGGVFTALSGKQNTIDAQHKLDYSLIANTPTIPADKVFIAEVDVTPYADVLAAVNDNSKVVFCQFLGLMIPYISKDNDGTIRFGVVVEKQDQHAGVAEYMSYIFWVDDDFGWNYAIGRRKPFLDTTSETALATNASESLMQTVKLHKVSKTGNYNDLLNKPTIPPADYVAMIDITVSFDGSGNPQFTATIVSGTLAEIEAALLAHKTVILIGRYSASNNVSYQYFHSGEHLPGVYVMFSTIGAEMIPGAVVVVAWRGEDSAGPERVDVYDGTGIMEASPMGDGNAVTSIERHNLLPMLIANKDKTFVDTAQQTLTDAQKSQARTNIGAGTYSKPSGGIPASDLAAGVIPTVPTDIVKYTAQTLTDSQKAQARTNIGAEREILRVTAGYEQDGETISADKTYDEISAAIADGKDVVVDALILGFMKFRYVGYFFAIYFACWFDAKMYVLSVSDNEGTDKWRLSTYNPEFTDNKVKTISSSSSDKQYPSAKAVYTELAKKQPTIDANHKLDYSLLSNTPTIPAAQVPADWNATEGVSRILNKPTVPATYAGSPTAGGFANKAVAIPFGRVDAGSTATALTATVDNFPTTLVDGVCAYIRNDVVASASGFTLNINGTGAKPVYQTMADASRATTIFSAAVTYLFIYNSSRVEGGCWDIYYGYNSNDNTIGYILRTNYMSLPTTSACYRYRLLFTSADGTHFVPANASSSTSATAAKTTTQTPIDPFGSIRYYNYTSAVSSGARPGVTYLAEQYQVTLGYSFNRTGAALTLTAWKPVYIKCAPQSDGSAIIDANNPYVQDLPTTADGKIYIFLGVATSATQVEVVFHHPVYYHDGTRVSIWPGVSVEDIKSSIGDIQTALDAIIGIDLPTFTITRNGVTTQYYFEAGMTWEEWVASEYNTDGYSVNGYEIQIGGSGFVAHDRGFPEDVIKTEGINASEAYVYV